MEAVENRDLGFEIEVDGEKVIAYHGESIAGVLFRVGKKTLRFTNREEPRGVFCGIGVCFECRMVVNSKRNTRVCQTQATPGCIVQTQHGDI
jgi:hypothetical protein